MNKLGLSCAKLSTAEAYNFSWGYLLSQLGLELEALLKYSSVFTGMGGWLGG